jgi:ABC-type glycerol-3-phosphate transport system substrate-binding protein
MFEGAVSDLNTSVRTHSPRGFREGWHVTRREFIKAATTFILGFPSAEVLSATSQPKSELHFVAWKYHLVGQEEYYRDLVKAFEHAHPGIRIAIELRDWTAAHGEIQHWISEGDGPDLTIVPDLWLSEFAPGLDDYVDRLPVKLLEGISPIMLKRSRFQGRVLGLVWAASTKALFYRTDLFKHAGVRPPSNWRELLVAAQKLTHPPNVYGLAIPGAPEDDTADNFYFFLWSNGGRLFTPSGKPALDTPESVEALTFLRDLVLKYHVTEPNVVQCSRTCAEELFAQGKAAMVETGPWLIRTIAAQAHPVPFSVVPLPWKKEPITQLVTDHLVLLRSSKHKSEALEFIKFAYQTSWRLRWARLGMVPALKAVENDKFFKDDLVWRVFIGQLSHARWIPLMNIKWVQADRAIRNSEGEVLAGRAEPWAALESLSKQIQILLAS